MADDPKGRRDEVRFLAINSRRWPPDAPMKAGPRRRMSGATADRLATVYSRSADLSFVVEAVEELLRRWEVREPPNDVILVALWQAAVIAYARGFGKREPRLSIDRVPVDFRATHRRVLEIRSLLIAHPISRQEQAGAGVELGADGSIGATHALRAIPALPTREVAQRLLGLVDAVGNELFAEEEALHSQLADEVRSLSTQARLDLPILELELDLNKHGIRGQHGRQSRS
jgi:hypothetical protein